MDSFLGLSNHQRAKWGFQRLFLSGCCRNITSEALSKFIFSWSFFAGRITRSVTSGSQGKPRKTSKCKVFPAEFGSSIKQNGPFPYLSYCIVPNPVPFGSKSGNARSYARTRLAGRY